MQFGKVRKCLDSLGCWSRINNVDESLNDDKVCDPFKMLPSNFSLCFCIVACHFYWFRYYFAFYCDIRLFCFYFSSFLYSLFWWFNFINQSHTEYQIFTLFFGCRYVSFGQLSLVVRKLKLERVQFLAYIVWTKLPCKNRLVHIIFFYFHIHLSVSFFSVWLC